MPADPRDDFGIFDGVEHMFFGLADPYATIRGDVGAELARRIPGCEVLRIAAHDAPRWRSLGRRDDHAPTLAITSWGVCFQARIAVAMGYGHEEVAACLTLLFRDWDHPTRQRARTYLDLHEDAALGYRDAVFAERFEAFRRTTDP